MYPQNATKVTTLARGSNIQEMDGSSKQLLNKDEGGCSNDADPDVIFGEEVANDEEAIDVLNSKRKELRDILQKEQDMIQTYSDLLMEEQNLQIAWKQMQLRSKLAKLAVHNDSIEEIKSSVVLRFNQQ